MNSEKPKKLLQTVGLSMFSMPLVSAQSIGQDLTLQESLLKFANDTLLMFEVSSATEVFLYFVAPMAGFYFIQKNMLSYGFELFEERLDRHTYGRTDDDIPNGIKGLSIVTSFITVQMLGMVSAGILFAAALISIILGILMQFGLLEGIELGGGNGGGGRNTTNNDTGNNNQQNQGGNGGGGRNIDWGNIGETAANFTNNIQQARRNRNNRSIEEALSVFNNGTDVIDLINKEPSDFRNHVQQIKNARKNDASDVNSLEEVLDRLEHIESEMEDLVSKAGDDYSDANNTGGTWEWENDSRIRSKIDGWNMIGQLTNLEQELKRIKSDQKNSIGTLEDQLDASWEDIQAYIKIHEFTDRLPKNPEAVARDNQLMNKLINEASNRNQLGTRSGGSAKSEFRSALEKMERFYQTHKNLLSNFENELEKELKLDQNEADDLKRISSDDDKIREAAKRTKRLVGEIDSTGSTDMSKGNPRPQQVKNQMNQISTLGDKIDNHIQDIHSIVQSEGEFENDTYQKLKQLK